MPEPGTQHRRLRVLFCGYGVLGLSILRGLLQCSDACQLVGVFRWTARTAEERKTDRDPHELAFASLVKEEKLTDIHCPGINSYEFSSLLGTLNPDVVLIGSWGEIIRPHVLERSGLILVNCHPSKLPRHRGANPYASVILAGEAETGVTFHRVAATVDSGPILLQQTLPIHAHDTGLSIRDRCAALAETMTPELIAALHAHIVEGLPLPETPQDESQSSSYPSLKSDEGLLDFSLPVETLERRLRGLYPWLLLYAYLEGTHLVVFSQPRLIRTSSSKEIHQPGEILSNRGSSLQIALSDPSIRLEAPYYVLILGNKTMLPGWLNRLFKLWLLRPGKSFRIPQTPE